MSVSNQSFDFYRFSYDCDCDAPGSPSSNLPVLSSVKISNFTQEGSIFHFKKGINFLIMTAQSLRVLSCLWIAEWILKAKSANPSILPVSRLGLSFLLCLSRRFTVRECGKNENLNLNTSNDDFFLKCCTSKND